MPCNLVSESRLPQTPPMDLSRYNNDWFDRGASRLKESIWLALWGLVRALPYPCYPLKRGLVRAFGATVSRTAAIKPAVRVTFPWKLAIGEHTWAAAADSAALAQTGDSLAAIAYDTGFSDQAHFTRRFKEATGTSPGAYRRLLTS